MRLGIPYTGMRMLDDSNIRSDTDSAVNDLTLAVILERKSGIQTLHDSLSYNRQLTK